VLCGNTSVPLNLRARAGYSLDGRGVGDRIQVEVGFFSFPRNTDWRGGGTGVSFSWDKTART
jgi:hypothetical protein